MAAVNEEHLKLLGALSKVFQRLGCTHIVEYYAPGVVRLESTIYVGMYMEYLASPVPDTTETENYLQPPIDYSTDHS